MIAFLVLLNPEVKNDLIALTILLPADFRPFQILTIKFLAPCQILTTAFLMAVVTVVKIFFNPFQIELPASLIEFQISPKSDFNLLKLPVTKSIRINTGLRITVLINSQAP